MLLSFPRFSNEANQRFALYDRLKHFASTGKEGGKERFLFRLFDEILHFADVFLFSSLPFNREVEATPILRTCVRVSFFECSNDRYGFSSRVYYSFRMGSNLPISVYLSGEGG